MTFKELEKQYKDYNIVVYGRPLDQKTIPFTLLPKDKPLEECEIADMIVEEKEHIEYGFSFNTMKPIKPKKLKGYVRVYVR